MRGKECGSNVRNENAVILFHVPRLARTTTLLETRGRTDGNNILSIYIPLLPPSPFWVFGDLPSPR